MAAKAYDEYEYGTNSAFQDRRREVYLNEDGYAVQRRRRRLCGQGTPSDLADVLTGSMHRFFNNLPYGVGVREMRLLDDIEQDEDRFRKLLSLVKAWKESAPYNNCKGELLIYAAERDNAVFARILLRNGTESARADADYQNSIGCTALVTAAQHEHENVMRELLYPQGRNAYLNVKYNDKYGAKVKTASTGAPCSSCNKDGSGAISKPDVISSYCEVKISDGEWTRATLKTLYMPEGMWIVTLEVGRCGKPSGETFTVYTHEDIRKIIDPDCVVCGGHGDESGWTALHAAAKNGNESVARLLLEVEHFKHEAVDHIADDSIVRARYRKVADDSIVTARCRKAWKLSLQTVTGFSDWTPLHTAASYGNEAVARLLLEKNPAIINDTYATNDHNKPQVKGNTVLHAAAQTTSKAGLEVVKLLLEKEPNMLATTNEDGWTALHTAARHGREKLVRFLINEKGADLKAVTKKNGETALHIAIRHGQEAVVEVFLKLCIKCNGSGEIPGLLFGSPCDCNTKGKLEGILNLASAGADKDQTPLFYAISYGQKQMVKDFLAKGAEIPNSWEKIKIQNMGEDRHQEHGRRSTSGTWEKDIRSESEIHKLVQEAIVARGKGKGRRLIAPTPEQPLVDCYKLSAETETPAIADSSYIPAMLFLALALLVGYLFFRCVKARRKPRPLAYPRGLLGGEDTEVPRFSSTL